MGPTRVKGAELVGRHGPQRRLLAALEEALAGHGRLVLVSGEAGIGKTALVGAVADAAADRAFVVWGTCWDGGGAPGYWPWSQALDMLVEAVGKERAARLAGDDVALLASIVPALEVGSHHADSGGDQTRLSLFSAMERWLARISAIRPVTVVLEDLHWADWSSLLLVDFLSRAHHTAPLLIIGTYRHDEFEAGIQSRPSTCSCGLGPTPGRIPTRPAWRRWHSACSASVLGSPCPDRTSWPCWRRLVRP